MNRNLVTLGRRSRHQGFSLIELMITIVVAAILLAIAIPSFRNLILSNELTTTTNEWVTAVNLARSEAIKRSAPVVVCGESSNQAASGDQTNTDVLVAGCENNLGEVRALRAGTTNVTVVRAALEKPDGIDLNNTQSLRFNGMGLGTRPNGSVPGTAGVTDLVAEIHSTGLAADGYRCIRLITRSTLTTESSDTACN
ncbi:MAG: GspH/FimT family pseudopilin [Halothiobacillaceae bacterium]|nr:GspH/FimT family pseudopilin [Halothiobacillaceae bacterium]HER34420.1 prepilin-type N-terminal cleavage/methylation domain-containing protein [Halothiobacillaceae bacterium]